MREKKNEKMLYYQQCEKKKKKIKIYKPYISDEIKNDAK